MHIGLVYAKSLSQKHNIMNCPKCNGVIESGQKFCTSCGQDLTQPPIDLSNVKPTYSMVGISVPCPECGKMTDSLKVYRLPDLWICLGVWVRYATKGHVCCPSCMRKKILLHGFTYNIVTANLLWPFIIMPWSIVNLFRTRSKGHSKEIVLMLNEQVN